MRVPRPSVFGQSGHDAAESRVPQVASRFWALTWAMKDPCSQKLTVAGCPLRLDLYGPRLPQRVMPITAPLPFLWARNETSLHQIAM